MAVPAILNDTNFKELVREGSFMNTSFRVRLATHADYDAVMKIDEDVAGGGDYLPSSYHDMMDNSRTHCFLAELDGEMVSISLLLIVLLKYFTGMQCFMLTTFSPN